MASKAKIHGPDVPQTRDLHVVRAVVAALHSGLRRTTDIARSTKVAPRHVNYALVTARAFGLLVAKGEGADLSQTALALLASEAASPMEGSIFRQAIGASELVSSLAPGLLGSSPPTIDVLADTIQRFTKLAPGTARHRAGAFLAWRKQLAQLSISMSTNTVMPNPAGRALGLAQRGQQEAGLRSRTITEDSGPEPEIERIRKKVTSNQYHQLLRSVTLDGLRGFKACKIDLPFPIVALAGENGAGKTTILKAMACAYEQARAKAKAFSPGLFFMTTQWDKVTGVTLAYSIKHGNEERTFDLRKPTERWRGIEQRPRRSVYFLDISRTMPIDALIGYAQIARSSIKLSSEDLDEAMRTSLSWVMGRSYKGAKFAVKAEKRVGVLTQDFGEYSKFHQGAGEASSLDLLGILQNVPDNSLVLLDEVEASLHPKAQRRLIRTLLALCRRKTLQIALSTHSKYILEELPPEARILLVKGRETRVVYGASPEYCLSTIDDRVHPDLTIFVEDREAAILVREMIARFDRENATSVLQRVDIVAAGASNVVLLLDSLGKQRVLRYPCVGVVDADCPDAPSGTAMLPGPRPPEREVFATLAANNWPSVADRFGMPFGEIVSHLEEASNVPDHHHWCLSVGNKVLMSRYRVWEALASAWVAQVLHADVLASFMERICDRMQ